jgi:hypothetical protein
MKIVGSVCRIKGERVALVMVDAGVLEFTSEADRYTELLSPAFDNLPVLLMAQKEGGATWYGRDDLVDAMGEIPPDQVPWQEMDLPV